MRDIVAALFDIPFDAPHLEQALTHPSFANEVRDAPDNQRLEFLGDAVLGLCTSQLLFERYPDADEGTLTRLRAQIVNTERLAEWGRAQGVSDALRLGRGALTSGLRDSTNVVADAVEACIAAAYLDGGLSAARSACARIVEPILELLGQNGARDPKSELQEYVQSRGLGLPSYEVCDSGGPAHDRWFEVHVNIAGRWLAKGRGRSKRLAERAAAEELLLHRSELLGEPVRVRDTTPDSPPDTMHDVANDYGDADGVLESHGVSFADRERSARDTLTGDTPPNGTSIDVLAGDTPASGTPIDALFGDTPPNGTPIDLLGDDTPPCGTPIDEIVGSNPTAADTCRSGVGNNVDSRYADPASARAKVEGKRP